MKRNFYALFALLTALSGPLVMAPPAISKADSEIRASDDHQTDDAVGSKARFEQEYNQPVCQFSPLRQEAPEDLVVLPEDFDYELFEGREACENLQLADANLEKEAVHGLSESPSNEIDPAFDQLCLPFIEWDEQMQPWEGPPVAGIDSSLMNPPASAEPASVAGGAWLAKSALRGSIALVNLLSQSVTGAAEHSVDAVRRLNELELLTRDFVFQTIATSLRSSWDDAVCEYSQYTYSLSGERLAPINLHPAERPFCFCWAKEESQVEMGASEGVSRGPIEGNQLDFAATDPVSTQAENPQSLPEVPAYEVPLIETSDVQNDAIEQPIADAKATSQIENGIDLHQLGQAAKQVWGVLVEKAVMIDQWTKDYDFEPFSAPQPENERCEE
jgi:hypothetical protein